MRYLKTFESYKEFIEEPLDIPFNIDHKWNPSDPQIWRGLEKWKRDDEGNMPATHIYRREDTKREIKGGMWEIVSHFSSWINFTDRSRSIISTTKKEYSDQWVGASLNYGESYVVLPIKDEIFVGVNQDFNLEGALPYFEEQIKLSGESWSIKSFVRDLHRISKYVGGDDIKNFRHWDELKDALDRSHEGDMYRLIDNLEDFSKLESLRERYKDILKFLKENNFPNLNDMMDHLLDPQKNGYRKMKYTDFIKELKKNPDMNIEVWFETDCYLIKQEDFQKMKSLPNKLKRFLNVNKNS